MPTQRTWQPPIQPKRPHQTRSIGHSYSCHIFSDNACFAKLLNASRDNFHMVATGHFRYHAETLVTLNLAGNDIAQSSVSFFKTATLVSSQEVSKAKIYLSSIVLPFHYDRVFHWRMVIGLPPRFLKSFFCGENSRAGLLTPSLQGKSLC